MGKIFFSWKSDAHCFALYSDSPDTPYFLFLKWLQSYFSQISISKMCLSVSQAKYQMDLNLMRQNVLFILIKPLTMFCYCIIFSFENMAKSFSFLANPFVLSSLSCLQRIIFVVQLIEMTSYWQPAKKQKCEMATT